MVFDVFPDRQDLLILQRYTYRLARAVMLCLAVVGAPQPTAAQARRALPDSLTDREFWQFFTTMSEEGGTFPSENFVSNERTYQHVIPTLQRTLTANGVYLGVGPEQNFTYIANLKPRMAVIFDIRRQNALTHLMYKALFELSPTRADFVSRLFSRPLAPSRAGPSATDLFAAVAAAPVSDSAFDATWKAIVDRLTVTHGFPLSDDDRRSMRRAFETFREAGPDISYSYRLGAPPSPTPWLVTYAQLQSLTNADSVNMAFLATDENYRWLRRLESRNLVVPVVGDFGGPKAIRNVGEYLKARGAVVTAFYVSNVEQYLFDGLGANERFYRNVATLPLDSTSSIIRSLPGGNAIVLPPPAFMNANGAIVNLRVVDSGAVRIMTTTMIDSAGRPVTTRVVMPVAPAATNAVAFVSGIAPMKGMLDAFANGRLTTYAQVTALTKTDGWSRLPRILVEKNVEARMRDGVILRADVYRPDTSARLPALLERTPYSKNPGRDDNQFRRMATHGYVVIVQDTRGRYTSDGVARPHDEADDGYDTIEWAAALPYVNGRIGMFGASYGATTQLMAAPLRPSHLVALFPASSYNSRYDMVFQGGAFYLADGLNWNLGQSADVRRRRLDPATSRDGAIGMTPAERQSFNGEWLLHVPLKTIDAMDLRGDAPGYFMMLDHPSYDAYWRIFDIESRHREIDVPALHLTGWYDALLNGTIRNFAGLRANARSARARDGQRLVIGPWTHSGPTASSTMIGNVDFGPEAGLDADALRWEWFDYWLKGASTNVLSRAPVRLFVMGANTWRDEREWPLKRAVATDFYLHSEGKANSLAGDGTLSRAKPVAERADTYTYDPANPVGTGARGGYSRSPSDQRDVEQRPDVLVYTTPPLDAPLEVTGPITVKLWAASSGTDTDFTAKLVDVLPDGTARALTDGILRARYRKSKTKPTLLTPGRPEEMTIDVGATSNVFLAGHRIRVEISSSNFPRYDRNPNTGAPFGEGAELRRAEQTILHDAGHPSRIVLPIVPR